MIPDGNYDLCKGTKSNGNNKYKNPFLILSKKLKKQLPV